MYTDPNLYEKLGKSFCFSYDVALAKSGSEAVVESLYSVMKTQFMGGMQSNQTLVQRTKIDWHLPKTPLGIEDFIKDATALYTSAHKNPISATLSKSKVMSRLELDRGKLPPIT